MTIDQLAEHDLIFLVGFMASGKTTHGRKLANRLERTFYDTDAMIERNRGEPIDRIFAAGGEDDFRREETLVVRSFFGRTGVVATGGGTPLYFGNMDWMLDNGLVIYLEHPAGQLAHRIEHAKTPRPLLADLDGDDLRARIEEMLAERAPVYERSHVRWDDLQPG